jgi:transcriptional regulator with XRE-family HTH domain
VTGSYWNASRRTAPDRELPRMPTSRVARWRDERALTQEELAARSGVRLGTLRDIEQGALKRPPDIRHLQNIAVALWCELDDLLEDAQRGWSSLPGGPVEPPAPNPNWRPAAEVRTRSGAL